MPTLDNYEHGKVRDAIKLVQSCGLSCVLTCNEGAFVVDADDVLDAINIPWQFTLTRNPDFIPAG